MHGKYVVIKQKFLRIFLNLLNSMVFQVLKFRPKLNNCTLLPPAYLKQERNEISLKLTSLFNEKSDTLCKNCFLADEHCCYSNDGVFSVTDTLFNNIPLRHGFNTQNSFKYAIQKSFAFLFNKGTMEKNGKLCNYLSEKGCELNNYKKPMGCVVAICDKQQRAILTDESVLSEFNSLYNSYYFLTLKCYFFIFKQILTESYTNKKMKTNEKTKNLL